MDNQTRAKLVRSANEITRYAGAIKAEEVLRAVSDEPNDDGMCPQSYLKVLVDQILKEANKIKETCQSQ